MASQWPENCDAIIWIMISNSLDIDFIHGDIHGRSCKKSKSIIMRVLKLFIHTLSSTLQPLTHWGRVAHICVGNLAIIGSDNDWAWWAPSRYMNEFRDIVNRTIRINFDGILIGIHTFSFKKIYLKISSAKSWSFCLGFSQKGPWHPKYI